MRILHGAFLLIAMLLLLVSSALADSIHLRAPATARQGSAVLITAVMDVPASSVTFAWKNKSIRSPVISVQEHWEASILLPVPVNAQKDIPIRASTENCRTEAVIHIQKVDWPRQHISVDKNYVVPPKATLDRITAEREKTSAVLRRISPERYWNGSFHRPVPGIITSAFGGKRVFNGEVRSYHRGVDLRAPSGTPVLALANGKVVLAENMYYAGNVVFIDHGLGLVSSYAHLSSFHVHPGDSVTAGQQIGLSGATGRVTGPHLHLGLNIAGEPVDPLSIFSQQ